MDTESEALEEKARQLVNQKQFKEAIAYYRQLWLQDDCPRWRQAMAQCYLARAREFARRSLYRQAIEQWRQYQSLAESADKVVSEVVLWQLGYGDVKAAQSLLSRLDAKQLDDDGDFNRILALLVLCQYPVLRDVLPKDSRFVYDLNVMIAALRNLPDKAACCEDLEKLPKHSAFVEIAQCVRSLLTADIAAAVTPDSILYSCYRMIPLLRLQGAKFVQAVLMLNSRQRQLLYRLRKLKPGQQQFIEQYLEHLDGRDNPRLVDLVMPFKSLTDIEVALKFCQANLPNDFICWLKFKKHFPQCSDFDLCRLKALACERSGDYRAAEQHWLEGISCLSGKAENQLKIALILRHIAAFYPPEEQQCWLKESLQYDPDDIETQDKLATLEPEAFLVSDEPVAGQPGELSALFSTISASQQQLLWQRADQLMMEFTPEQLAQEFQPELESVDLEQLLARTPALMEGLLLLKAARQLALPVSVTVSQLVNTVVMA
jgi:tetratricopeptide (TPR) repeat protein